MQHSSKTILARLLELHPTGRERDPSHADRHLEALLKGFGMRFVSVGQLCSFNEFYPNAAGLAPSFWLTTATGDRKAAASEIGVEKTTVGPRQNGIRWADFRTEFTDTLIETFACLNDHENLNVSAIEMICGYPKE